MANLDIVDGFKPFGRIYPQSSYVAGGTIYKGDALKLKNDGTVERAAAGDALIGIAVSNAASAESVLVADHPDQLFIGQADDATIDAQTDIGLNCDIVVAAANTTYKRSGMELDASTVDTTSTLVCRVERIVKAPDNALGANVKVVFSINSHQRANARTGV